MLLNRLLASRDRSQEEVEEYVLTAADAPKNVTKFDVGEGPDLAFEEEEYSASGSQTRRND